MGTVLKTLLLVSLSVLTLAARQAAPVPPSALPTANIEVDGAQLRVRSALVARNDAPVVVFESGAGMPLDTWDVIIDKIAALAPVVAYDRPGTGKSGWNGESLTPQAANQRLKKLLDRLGVTEPFILVGHSWGGALARYFAGEYPRSLKAILYIDPTDITMTEPMWQQMFASFGASPKDMEAFFTVMDTSSKDLPPAARAESLLMMTLLRTPTLEARQLKPAPEIPASVLLASRVASLPKGMVPFDGEAYARALQNARTSGLREWTHGSGRYQVVDGAGHFVYRDAPDVVIAELRRLIDSTRAQ